MRTRSRKSPLIRPLLGLVLLAAFAAPSPAQQSKTQLKTGDRAPDFQLIDTNRRPVKLSDFKGKKNVVLAFYVLAFTGG